MKRFVLFFMLFILLSGSLSCQKAHTDDPADNPYRKLELSTKSSEFVHLGNDFAFNFLDRVDGAVEGDYIISPLSMQFLLGMVLDGARGETADEICSVLGYGAGETDAVNEYCQAMLQQLPSLDKKTSLSIANAIAVNQRCSLHENYKNVVGEFYDTEIFNLDFSDGTGSAKHINQWCSDRTHGLIPEVIQEVRPGMLAYLMNAMYFKGQWKSKFSKADTAKERFTTGSGTAVKVQMMKKHASFLYQDNDVFRAVRLPYGNGAFAMNVILPAEGRTLSDITGALDASAWHEFVQSMVGCDVDMWLPRFKTRFHIKLNDILSAMGMPSAFNVVSADFKAMSDDALCLSFVQQDACIKVDEEGSEAAVVSVAGMMEAAAAPGEFVQFHVDRPFLYLITETSSETVLFAGKYTGE